MMDNQAKEKDCIRDGHQWEFLGELQARNMDDSDFLPYWKQINIPVDVCQHCGLLRIKNNNIDSY